MESAESKRSKNKNEDTAHLTIHRRSVYPRHDARVGCAWVKGALQWQDTPRAEVTRAWSKNYITGLGSGLAGENRSLRE